MNRIRFACGLFALLFALTACETSHLLPEAETNDTAWSLVNPRPFDVRINDLWGTSTGRIMAVGDAGAVITREGDVWRTAPRATRTNIYDIHGYDWQHIWALSAEGVLFFNGSRWALQRAGQFDRYDRVFCRAPDDVMIVTTENVSLHFDGESWTRQELNIRSTAQGDWLVGWPGGYTAVGRSGQSTTWNEGTWGPIETVEGAADFTHVVLTPRFSSLGLSPVPLAMSEQSGEPGVFRSHIREGLDDWSALRTYSIDGTLLGIIQDQLDDNFFIVSRSTSRDTIRIQERSQWEPPIVFPGINDAAVQFFRNHMDYSDRRGHFVLAGPYGSFYTGNEEGGVESSVGKFSFEAKNIHVWSNGDFVATDGNTQLMHGIAGQVTVQTETLSGGVQDVWGPSPDVAYGVGSNGLIVRLTPNAPPEPMTAPTSDHLNAVWGRSGNDIWAGGYRDFLHFNGSAWTSIPVPTGFHCFDITGTVSGDVYVQSFEKIFRWDGTEWAIELDTGETRIHGMSAASDGEDLFALVNSFYDIESDQSIVRLRDGEWELLAFVPLGTRSLAALSDESVMIANSRGCFQWADNTWQPVPHPVSEAKSGYAEKIFGNTTGGIYSISNRYSIHYLDLGGTGLWQ